MTAPRQAEWEQQAREWLTSRGLQDLSVRTQVLDVADVVSLATLLKATEAAALEEALGVVESEEELPGDMPDEMFKAITWGDKALATETLRAVVRATKKSIQSRLKERRS
jgi:cell division protein ZapA (FtsZ GTPase activity inhibitor)